MSARLVLAVAADRRAAVAGAIADNGMVSEGIATAVLDAFNAATPVAELGEFLLAYLLACADQGTAGAAQLAGENQGVPFTALSSQIKRRATVRQFAMFYAKVTWNALLEAQRPPANWQKRGYTPNTRFAAFDFFHGVRAGAALEPAEGLRREPSEDEVAANQANREIAIQMSRTKAAYTTNGMMMLRQQQEGAQTQHRLLM